MALLRNAMHVSMLVAIILVAAASLWGGVAAQSSSSCTSVIVSMSPCLDYITGNSSTPSSSCCSQLSNVVRSSPQCLCEVINGGGSSLGVNVNQTQALALPNACKVQTPPASQCNAASPSGSPSGTSNSPSGGSGSKTVPTTDNGTSDGNSIKFQFSLFFCLLFIALSFSSSLTSI